MNLIQGERVKIVKSRNDELVGKVGTVISERTAFPRHIKISVKGNLWYVTHDEIEPVAVSRAQARREAQQ